MSDMTLNLPQGYEPSNFTLDDYTGFSVVKKLPQYEISFPFLVSGSLASGDGIPMCSCATKEIADFIANALYDRLDAARAATGA